jgi:stage V sporulation protein SpoVS
MAVDRKLLDDHQWTVTKMMVNHIDHKALNQTFQGLDIALRFIAQSKVVTFIVAAVVGAVLSHLDA